MAPSRAGDTRRLGSLQVGPMSRSPVISSAYLNTTGQRSYGLDPIERVSACLVAFVLPALNGRPYILSSGFVCLVVLVRFMPASPVTPSMPTQQPIASSTTTITPRAAEPIRRESPNRASPPRSESHTKSPAKSSGAHKESLRERAYESLTGKEVVHRKDGSTFERKQPNKK